MYENVIESYVEDIYTGVIEDYTIATVKVGTQFFRCGMRMRVGHGQSVWLNLRK